jgi:phosphoglycerate-specific signal transduction histidine kinase
MDLKTMADQWLPVYISLLTPIATLAVVLVGFLYNNSRFTELSKSVDSRISELSKSMDSRINELSKSMDSRINELSKSVDSRISDLKDLIKAQGDRFDAHLARVESSLLSKFAELDTRLTRIESRIS